MRKDCGNMVAAYWITVMWVFGRIWIVIMKNVQNGPRIKRETAQALQSWYNHGSIFKSCISSFVVYHMFYIKETVGHQRHELGNLTYTRVSYIYFYINTHMICWSRYCGGKFGTGIACRRIWYSRFKRISCMNCVVYWFICPVSDNNNKHMLLIYLTTFSFILPDHF